MSTSLEFIEYVCSQINNLGNVQYKKLFGEYMVYINKKPIYVVCDNIVYIKEIDCIKQLMVKSDRGYPYKGAKEHYILDIDNYDLCQRVTLMLEQYIPVPIPKKRK